MKIDFENIAKITGIDFTQEPNQKELLFDYILNLIEYLAEHNQNYTNAQYHKIIDLTDILHNIEL